MNKIDRITKNLMKQIRLKSKGRPSIEDDMGKYRANDGNCSLIGCLIPDELYRPDIEDLSPHLVFKKYKDIYEHINKTYDIDENLICDIEEYHDEIDQDIKPEDFFNEVENEISFLLEKRSYYR